MNERETETRYYAFSGRSRVLNQVETLLRYIERTGEQGVMRLFSTFVDGRNGANVRIRVLASRDGSESAGSGLPRLTDESVEQPHYVIDITMPRD